ALEVRTAAARRPLSAGFGLQSASKVRGRRLEEARRQRPRQTRRETRTFLRDPFQPVPWFLFCLTGRKKGAELAAPAARPAPYAPAPLQYHRRHARILPNSWRGPRSRMQTADRHLE